MRPSVPQSENYRSLATGCSVAISHSRMNPSWLATAKKFPFGEKLAPRGSLMSRLKCCSRPVGNSFNRKSPSMPDVRCHRPSGDTQDSPTGSAPGLGFLPGGQVPLVGDRSLPCKLLVHDQLLAIGQKLRRNRGRIVTERTQPSAFLQIPELDDPISQADGQLSAVFREACVLIRRANPSMAKFVSNSRPCHCAIRPSLLIVRMDFPSEANSSS